MLDVKLDGRIDYVIEFKADENNIFRILIDGISYKTHIYALKKMAEFILNNDIESITILKCKEHICNKVIAEIKVLGND